MMSKHRRSTKWVSAQMVCLVVSVCAGAACAGDIAFLRRTGGYWQAWTIDSSGKKARQITRSPCDKTRLSWLPGGRELVFSCVPGKVGRVKVLDGTETSIDLSVPDTLDAVVSPDGERIAFSFIRAEAIDGNDIWTSRLDGSERRKLAALPGLQHEPAWSADGKALYFSSGEGGPFHDIWVVSTDPGEQQPRQLTKRNAYHFDVAVSKDGTLAFSSNRSGDYEIWLRTPAGEERQLSDRPEMDARPSFSSDGQQIVAEAVVAGVPNLLIWDVATARSRPLTKYREGARSPVWRRE
jgi:Tol biopolymer transport system component